MPTINDYKNRPADEIKTALELAYEHEQGLRATLTEANATTRTLRAARHCATIGAWPGDVVTYQGKKYRLSDEVSESMFSIRGHLIKADGTASSRASNIYLDGIKAI